MTLQQQLESALSHHQAGRLAEAEAIYRQILSQHPNQAEALNLLGTLAAQVGQSDVAVEFDAPGHSLQTRLRRMRTTTWESFCETRGNSMTPSPPIARPFASIPITPMPTTISATP